MSAAYVYILSILELWWSSCTYPTLLAKIPITNCFLHHPTAWLIYFPIFPFDLHLFLLLREAFEAFVTDWMSLSQARSSVGWILFLQYNTIRFTELCQVCSLFSLNFTLCSNLSIKLYMHEYSTKWHISGKWYGQCWLHMVKEDMQLLKVVLWCPHTLWNCCTQIHIGPQQIHINKSNTNSNQKNRHSKANIILWFFEALKDKFSSWKIM